MDSGNHWREPYFSHLLELQELVDDHFGDERLIADYVIRSINSLIGAERVILRRKKENKKIVLAHYNHDKVACSPDELIAEALSAFTSKEHIESPNSSESFYSFFPLPVILDKYGFSLRNYMCVTPTVFKESALEIVIINMKDDFCQLEILEALEILLNIVSQSQRSISLRDSIHLRDREITKIVDSKTQFLGSLSHEIRSPLNGIICMGSLLRETSLDEEQQDLLNIIQFSADNITRIIQDLVDLTMLTSGKVHLKNDTFSLITLCNNLIKNLKEEASLKGLNLAMNIEEEIDSFHGDSVRISQILSNLLQNAIKYTNEGEIFLDIRRQNKSIEFVVSDTGVGIAQEKQDMIFEEFIQLGVNTGRKGQSKGVGLGLAIVKDLVEMMGGTVNVRSREGKGSSFIVVLPDLVQERQDLSPKGSNVSFSYSEEIRILIADDDEINRLYLRTILERRGSRIDEAENGLIAVEKVAKNKYDMVLMDISMPVMNGLDATRQIRQSEKTVPILAVTANAFEEDFKRILESGVDDIVLKPVDEDQLMDKISTWFDRKRDERLDRENKERNLNV